MDHDGVESRDWNVNLTGLGQGITSGSCSRRSVQFAQLEKRPSKARPLCSTAALVCDPAGACDSFQPAARGRFIASSITTSSSTTATTTTAVDVSHHQGDGSRGGSAGGRSPSKISRLTNGAMSL